MSATGISPTTGDDDASVNTTGANKNTCAICLEPLFPSGNNNNHLQGLIDGGSPPAVGVSVPCGHCFHQPCFEEWQLLCQQSCVKCPTCNCISHEFIKIFIDATPEQRDSQYDDLQGKLVRATDNVEVLTELQKEWELLMECMSRNIERYKSERNEARESMKKKQEEASKAELELSALKNQREQELQRVQAQRMAEAKKIHEKYSHMESEKRELIGQVKELERRLQKNLHQRKKRTLRRAASTSRLEGRQRSETRNGGSLALAGMKTWTGFIRDVIGGRGPSQTHSGKQTASGRKVRRKPPGRSNSCSRLKTRPAMESARPPTAPQNGAAPRTGSGRSRDTPSSPRAAARAAAAAAPPRASDDVTVGAPRSGKKKAFRRMASDSQLAAKAAASAEKKKKGTTGERSRSAPRTRNGLPPLPQHASKIPRHPGRPPISPARAAKAPLPPVGKKSPLSSCSKQMGKCVVTSSSPPPLSSNSTCAEKKEKPEPIIISTDSPVEEARPESDAIVASPKAKANAKKGKKKGRRLPPVVSSFGRMLMPPGLTKRSSKRKIIIQQTTS